jgi:hypothetical protein
LTHSELERGKLNRAETLIETNGGKLHLEMTPPVDRTIADDNLGIKLLGETGQLIERIEIPVVYSGRVRVRPNCIIIQATKDSEKFAGSISLSGGNIEWKNIGEKALTIQCLVKSSGQKIPVGITKVINQETACVVLVSFSNLRLEELGEDSKDLVLVVKGIENVWECELPVIVLQ